MNLKLPNKIYLDSVYRAPKKPILLVVDLRVALYGMLNRSNLLSRVNPQEFWRYYLNALPTIIHSSLINRCHLVVVDDWRSGTNYNYWREDWLNENYPNAEVYKGNRGVIGEQDRPGGYNELLSGCYDYCERAGIPVYRQESFEADDFAGAFYRIANGKYQTIFVSIDNDWGQLVCNSKDTIQYINGQFKVPISRLRSEYEIYQYYEQRHDEMFKSTYDIVDYKAEYGDAGDNIMENSPREIIDLRDPPLKPELDKSKIFTYKCIGLEAMLALNLITEAEFAL